MQLLIDNRRHQGDQGWLEKNPTVEALFEKGWGVVKIPIADIEAMGFTLEDPDSVGHLNLLGSDTLFAERRADFTELIKDGKAVLLSEEDCIR